jgi:transposase
MTTALDPREQRGLIIAAMHKLENKKGLWLVPSQSGSGKYTVDPERQICTCPDHQDSGFKCKHIRAVEIVIKRETAPDGTVTETKSITFTEKTTYRQNWGAYNAAQSAAQSVEKDRFQELLADLGKGIQEPVIEGPGRRPHSLRDMVFAVAFKVYSGFSSRRFSTDLRDAHKRGFTAKVVPGLKVNCFLENPALTPILKELIVRSSLPLRSVETSFAIDSSGFSSGRFSRWFDEKWGKERKKADWVKVHLATGVKTNVVTAVRILDKDSADSPQFSPLVKETSRSFEIGEVSADKAYASLENFEMVAACGGTGFIAFKANATGYVGGEYEKMFHYFQFKKEEYFQHYHKWSNVESTFSAIKRKFGDAVRSRTDVSMANEVLCKVLCHNLCVLIQEQHELGIEPIFAAKTTSIAVSTA